MKKALRRILFVVPVLAVVLFIGVYLFLNSIVRSGVETALPMVTGTPVKLNSVAISLLSGKGTLKGFIIGNPEGVVGKATLADVEKARPGVEALLVYIVKLHDDIMARFPVGKLPDASLVTQRFTQEEVDELLKGPLDGGKHLYTVAWPPC